MEIGLVVLRLTVVLTVAAHGSHKLLGLFGGTGLDGTVPFPAMLGFPSARRNSLMAGLAETGGGLLVPLGPLTQVRAAAIISVMLVAVYTVHIKKGLPERRVRVQPRAQCRCIDLGIRGSRFALSRRATRI